MNVDDVGSISTCRWRSDEQGLERLVGSRCRACDAITFPAQPSCPRCTSNDVREHLLATHGTLWTWTIQGFPPKSPPYAGVVSDFVPYPVGYVELPGEAVIEARLVSVDPDLLTIGDPMRLVIWPFERADGTTFSTYGFTAADR